MCANACFFFHISPGINISCCSRLYFCAFWLYLHAFFLAYFCALRIYLHAFYLAAASTSSALLDIPSLQSHIVIFENKSINQQQHSHSMVFVIFSIEFTQNKNKTCLRIFTVMLFDQQLQPQIIL